MFLKFEVARVCEKSFFNERMEYSCLGYSVLAKFLEPSLRFLLMHA